MFRVQTLPITAVVTPGSKVIKVWKFHLPLYRCMSITEDKISELELHHHLAAKLLNVTQKTALETC